jgi:hypothetical protein
MQNGSDLDGNRVDLEMDVDLRIGRMGRNHERHGFELAGGLRRGHDASQSSGIAADLAPCVRTAAEAGGLEFEIPRGLVRSSRGVIDLFGIVNIVNIVRIVRIVVIGVGLMRVVRRMGCVDFVNVHRRQWFAGQERGC